MFRLGRRVVNRIALVATALALVLIAQPVMALDTCRSEADPDATIFPFPLRDGTDDAMIEPVVEAVREVSPEALAAPFTCERTTFSTPAGQVSLSGENTDPYPRRAITRGRGQAMLIYLLPVRRPDDPRNLYALVSTAPEGRQYVTHFFVGVPDDASLTAAIREFIETGEFWFNIGEGPLGLAHWVPGGVPAPPPGMPPRPGLEVLVSGERENYESTAAAIRQVGSNLSCPREIPDSRMRLWGVRAGGDGSLNCQYRVRANERDGVVVAIEPAPGALLSDDVDFTRSRLAETAQEAPAPRLDPPLPEGVETLFFRRRDSSIWVFLMQRSDWIVTVTSIHDADPSNDQDVLTVVRALLELVSAQP